MIIVTIREYYKIIKLTFHSQRSLNCVNNVVFKCLLLQVCTDLSDYEKLSLGEEDFQDDQSTHELCVCM